MNLQQASIKVLMQLLNVLEQIQTQDYTADIERLEATVGQHTRHILEFYTCLINGLETGIVNYDHRKRDNRIETDKFFAIQKIKETISFMKDFQKNPALSLIISYDYSALDNVEIKTSFQRELAYNIEHTIHHLAIMKPTIVERCAYIILPEYFGIASSTVRYTRSNN